MRRPPRPRRGRAAACIFGSALLGTMVALCIGTVHVHTSALSKPEPDSARMVVAPVVQHSARSTPPPVPFEHPPHRSAATALPRSQSEPSVAAPAARSPPSAQPPQPPPPPPRVPPASASEHGAPPVPRPTAPRGAVDADTADGHASAGRREHDDARAWEPPPDADETDIVHIVRSLGRLID